MKKKILFFHPLNDFSGSTTALRNMLEHDFSSDDKLDIVTDGENGALTTLGNVHLIQIWYPRLKTRKIFIVSFVFKIISFFVIALLKRKDYDLYYLNTITVYPVAIVGRICKKEIYWHIHEKFTYSSSFYAALERKIMLFVFNHTICTRIFVSNYIKDQYKRKEKCIEIIKPNLLSKNYINNILPIPIIDRKRNTILMLSSLTKSKGLFVFVEIANRMPNFSFILVISSTQEEINSFFNIRIPHNLQIYSRQDDVHPFMRRSDLLVNLTNPYLCIESFGMTIIEAMAYGIPAIVPNIGGPTEIVKNGYNGYCVDVTNVNLICEVIIKIFSTQLYYKMAENCFIESKKYFGYGSISNYC